ncbi:MAG: phosphate signaling complex protein PhoU [Spirochaetaceae bacterium]|nr:MAG: phosphate signaling complex protein PhoU [Spirochaetaceae bacterium]
MMRQFEGELDDLKKQLLSMGKLVETMIHNAIRSILDRNENLRKDVFAHEDEVNRNQVEIDDHCITMIALRQPAAVDLRFITSAMKINSDLERMGDQAVNIAEHNAKSTESVSQPMLEQVTHMSEKVKKMVRDSLDAFVKKDIRLAEAVLASDDEVDSSKDDITRKLTDCMKGNPESISHSLEILLIARNLERIGDHATNIAEDVIYMVKGKDIRHHMYDR